MLQRVGVQRVYAASRGVGAVLEKRNHTLQSLFWTLGTLSLGSLRSSAGTAFSLQASLRAGWAGPEPACPCSPSSCFPLTPSSPWGRAERGDDPSHPARSSGAWGGQRQNPPGIAPGRRRAAIQPFAPSAAFVSRVLGPHLSILGCRPPLMGTKGEGGGQRQRPELRHLPLPGTRPLPGPRRPPPFRGAGPGGAESDRIGSSWIGSGWVGLDRIGSEQVRSSGGAGAARGR